MDGSSATRWGWAAACCGLGVVLAASSGVRGQCYEVTAVIQGPNCGPPFGFSPTIARGINDAGEVAGYYITCAIGPGEAFFWSAGTGLVTLDRPPPYVSAAARDINNAGQIAGAIGVPTTDGPYAALWQDGQVFDLGTLPGGDFSQGRAINSRGEIAGRWGNENTGPLHAFIWRDGKMFDLGPDLGTKSSDAWDVNDAGEVVGWMGTSSVIDSHAFIWQDRNVSDLGVIPGGFTAVARASSNADHVVGSGQLLAEGWPFGVSRTFYWKDGKMINIGTLPGYPLSAALDVNDSGVVVGSCWGGSEPETAFVWQDGIMRDLNDLILLDSGVHIAEAWAINNQGQITGKGKHENGDIVGVVLTPIEPALGDLTCDGRVLHDDLAILLATWGPCPAPPDDCPADLNGDGTVGVADLLILFANWG